MGRIDSRSSLLVLRIGDLNTNAISGFKLPAQLTIRTGEPLYHDSRRSPARNIQMHLVSSKNPRIKLTAISRAVTGIPASCKVANLQPRGIPIAGAVAAKMGPQDGNNLIGSRGNSCNTLYARHRPANRLYAKYARRGGNRLLHRKIIRTDCEAIGRTWLRKTEAFEFRTELDILYYIVVQIC